MKFAVRTLSALVAGGLLMGAMIATPASAGKKKTEETDIFKIIDSDLKRLDKELFGWLRK